MSRYIIYTTAFVLTSTIHLFAQIGAADPVTGNAVINFWGKVVDQDNLPIVDAVITLQMDYGLAESGMKNQSLKAKSDENGKFKLINLEGHGLEILSVEKAGYILSDKMARSYRYSWSGDIFHPNEISPVIFRMWKQHGCEPLTHFSCDHKIFCDGRTNAFSLLNGQPQEAGELHIVCSRTPLEPEHPGNHPFDYTFQIDIVGGGIQPTSDEFTYFAPKSGYKPNWILAQKAGDQNWHGKVKQEFYIKTVEGHYGRLTVDWYAWQTNPTHFDWNCSINPTGSRNLER